MRTYKVMTAIEAADLIKSGDTVAVGGAMGGDCAEALLLALGEKFRRTGEPCGLTLFFGTAKGAGCARGIDYLADPKMLKRVIGADYSLLPEIETLIGRDMVEGYCLPQGVLSHLFRDIAAKRPRTITHVGLGTEVDPGRRGGRMNGRTREEIVERVSFDGRGYLAYKTFGVDVALLCGTTADASGNFAVESGGLALDTLAIAAAAHNSGGKVIVQVERLAEAGMFSPSEVVVPGLMVDAVVVSSPELAAGRHSESFVPYGGISGGRDAAVTAIARRAMAELAERSVVFFGPGLGGEVSREASEWGVLERVRQINLLGMVGIDRLGSLGLASPVDVEMIMDKPSHYDFIAGGGVDTAFIEMGAADESGDVMAAVYGEPLTDSCTLTDVAQSAKKVVFVGRFGAGEVSIFVKKAERVAFCGKTALERGQRVLYITERCVMELTPEGLSLLETAPGVGDGDLAEKIPFIPADVSPRRGS